MTKADLERENARLRDELEQAVNVANANAAEAQRLAGELETARGDSRALVVAHAVLCRMVTEG